MPTGDAVLATDPLLAGAEPSRSGWVDNAKSVVAESCEAAIS